MSSSSQLSTLNNTTNKAPPPIMGAPSANSFAFEPESSGNRDGDQEGGHIPPPNSSSDCSDVSNYDHDARRSKHQTRVTSNDTIGGSSATTAHHRDSASQSRTSFSMKEWMVLALADATQKNNRPLVASEEYITAALKVGLSLARQLCQAEESEANMAALTDLNWSELITVHLGGCDNSQEETSHCPPEENDSNDNNNGGGNFTPLDGLIDLDIIGGRSSFLDELETTDYGITDDQMNSLLNSSFEQKENENCELNSDVEANKVEQGVSADPDEKCIFDVDKAEILLCSEEMKATTSDATRLNAQLRRVHSLGIVFYELFSGGMRPVVLNEKMEDAEASKKIDLSSALKLTDGHDFKDSHEEKVGNQTSQSKRARPDKIISSASCKSSSFVASTDHLNSMSIPTCICDLVDNMIDSINGDLSGEEAYQSIQDVQNSLEWMLRNSDRIICDADPNAVIKAEALTKDSLYGRGLAFDQLKQSYDRYLSGGRVMALIAGPSGTGKSSLAQKMAHHSTQTRGIFLSGKFDQLQQSIPFSAIASAFNEYCDHLAEQGTSIYTQMISSRLHAVLGQEISLLVRLIPSLKQVLGQDFSENYQDQGCVNAQKRLQYILCQFVDVISNSSGSPITLFLDDLQWADFASIEVIRRLLLDSGSSTRSKLVFFLGCFREDEKSNDHPLWYALSNVGKLGVHVDLIQLACLQKDCVNELISDVLCLPPRSTRPLSEIVYHKTNGNPQFVLQLLKALNNECLLRLSLSRRRWEWDEAQIQSRKLPDDVAMAFTNTINQLPVTVTEALCIASCFGNHIEQFVLDTLEKEIQKPLSSALDLAVSKGLMDKHHGSYYFAHDRVQEAVYGMIKPEEQCLHHYRYGLSLASHADTKANNAMLFTAVDQINRGGPMAMVDKAQSCIVADLNLQAGKKAIEVSDFATALKFFDNGISFLIKNHWTENYDLSLDLYVEAAKCALAVGDMATLNILSEQVLTFGQSFEDKLDVIYAGIRALEIGAKVATAIEKEVAVLAQLGVPLLDQPTSWKTNGLLTQTKKMLDEYSDQDLLNHREMTDATKIMSMKFLVCAQTSLNLTNPAYAPEATLKMVQLSLMHGMSPFSPTAFVYYGSLLAACGEVREGSRFVKIALGLLKRPQSSVSSSEVFTIASNVMVCVDPLQSLGEYTISGYRHGLASGDINVAMLCLTMNQTFAFWGGKKLNFVMRTMEHNISMKTQFNQERLLSHALPLYRTTMSLIGRNVGINTAYGKCLVDEMTESETATIKHDPVQFKIVLFNKMYIAFIFRRFDTMKEFANIFFTEKVASFYIFFMVNTMNTFFGGLCSFWIARRTRESAWFERGEKALSQLKDWAESSKWNFLNKLQLLEAEKHYYLRDMEKAKFFYNASISSAKTHKFIHEEALACELAGYFFSDELGQADLALPYFERAHLKYEEWGASGKAKELIQYKSGSNTPIANLAQSSGTDSNVRKRNSKRI